MKKFLTILCLIVSIFLLFGCSNGKMKGIKWAGARSSSYGIMPFPGPSGWKNAINDISGSFDGAKKVAIWIVGETGPTNEVVQLQFPTDGKKYKNIMFNNTDKHELYLDYFDKNDIYVWLQVEPCSADVVTLIDIVLNRYKHHKSVIGFGVDCEWYLQKEAEELGMDPGFGMKVLDEDAEKWEKAVKAHNKDYTVFLKHWDLDWMPPNYRGDIIFINDTQELAALKAIVFVYKEWADAFYPNPIMIQTGYLSDKRWWKKLDNPPLEIAKACRKGGIKNPMGVAWVDFTLADVANVEDDEEMEISDIDKDNLAHGKPTESSAIETEGFEASKAVDGNPSTRWSSKDVDPSWFYVDLQESIDMKRVVLVWETSYSSKYKLEVSEDAQNWTQVYYDDTNMGDIQEIKLENAKGRYIKLTGIERAYDEPEYGHSLWEIKVYDK